MYRPTLRTTLSDENCTDQMANARRRKRLGPLTLQVLEARRLHGLLFQRRAELGGF
jgi:hypothetical protein